MRENLFFLHAKTFFQLRNITISCSPFPVSRRFIHPAIEMSGVMSIDTWYIIVPKWFFRLLHGKSSENKNIKLQIDAEMKQFDPHVTNWREACERLHEKLLFYSVRNAVVVSTSNGSPDLWSEAEFFCSTSRKIELRERPQRAVTKRVEVADFTCLWGERERTKLKFPQSS